MSLTGVKIVGVGHHAPALSESVQAGTIEPGNVIVFVAFGGGLSWGTVAWRRAA
ncbi:MAG: 3-oxoacyl-[acyl-carrier-protein] synthase III C-terminal domain-containing protein [Candidatus Tumulicola sp.]